MTAMHPRPRALSSTRSYGLSFALAATRWAFEIAIVRCPLGIRRELPRLGLSLDDAPSFRGALLARTGAPPPGGPAAQAR